MSLEPFKFGKHSITLYELLGPTAISRTKKKFPAYSDSEIFTALREVARYLYLTANSDTSLFFPGNQLMDDVWHSFIIETAEYRTLCSKLRPGYFLEHSGMRFNEYTSTRSAEEINNEQLSWLVSYFDNFGPFSEESFAMIALAQDLAARLNFDRDKLNQFAEKLYAHAIQNKSKAPFDLKTYLNEISSSLANIANDPRSLEIALRNILSGLCDDKKTLPTNEDLELVYTFSTALGFTLWQHLAAVERLQGYEEWQANNQVLWQEILNAQKLVGLGTTHLAHAGKAPLSGVLTNNEYLITGTIPWATGTGMFDYILLAFEAGEDRVFSIIPFPTTLRKNETVEVIPYKLSCINGSSTSRINFTNFSITNDQVIFLMDKKAPRPNRKSQYVFPEIGMAVSAINMAENILSTSHNPRHQKAKEEISVLKKRLSDFKSDLSRIHELDSVLVSYQKDELIRDAVRFLILAAGGSAMSLDSLPSRLLAETMLLDVLIQDPRLIEHKTTTTCHE